MLGSCTVNKKHYCFLETCERASSIIFFSNHAGDLRVISLRRERGSRYRLRQKQPKKWVGPSGSDHPWPLPKPRNHAVWRRQPTTKVNIPPQFLSSEQQCKLNHLWGVWDSSRFQLQCGAVIYNINLNIFKNIFNL
jgi:hypothetical protein